MSGILFNGDLEILAFFEKGVMSLLVFITDWSYL
jgi:hypothetical protein